MTRIPLLDLFSGIGGFSYALKTICRTVGYCEIDPVCRQVLQTVMDNGYIDSARIFDDITNLPAGSVPPEVRMISAGSPYQDISVANSKGLGLRGPRSHLLAYVFRIAAHLPQVHTVFLENSSNLGENDIRLILQAFRDLGFTARWGIFSAADVGAPHLRKRWFCLAQRNAARRIRFPFNKIENIWKREKVARLIFRQNSAAALRRCSILGNSVVPQVAQYAFAMLNDQQLRTDKTASAPVICLIDGKRKVLLTRWGTPCRTITSWYHYNLSKRSAANMANQLFYDKHTADTVIGYKLKHAKNWMVNPQFVEWTMGYPTDYTKF